MTPSPADVLDARTEKGGFSKESFRKLGVPYPPGKHWRRKLLRRWRAEQRPKAQPTADLDELVSLNEWL